MRMLRSLSASRRSLSPCSLRFASVRGFPPPLSLLPVRFLSPPCISPRASAVSNPSSASAMNGWDSRSMLERCIYDYLIKKQMHETLEIFEREAALTFETAPPGGIDVPEGLLYEWWLIFYEAFMASQPNNRSFSGSSPTMMMTFPQETTASLTRQPMMNEEMTRDSAIDTNTGLILGDSFMWSKEWPSTKADHLPQNLMPLTYQQNPSTFSSTLNPVVVTDDLIPQGGPHLMPPGLENHILSSRKSEDHKKIIVLSRLAESSKKRKASSEGNSDMPGFFLLHSETTVDNPSDMSAEANSSDVNDINGEANISSSASKKCSSASDASKDILMDNLCGNTLVEKESPHRIVSECSTQKHGTLELPFDEEFTLRSMELDFLVGALTFMAPLKHSFPFPPMPRTVGGHYWQIYQSISLWKIECIQALSRALRCQESGSWQAEI